MNLNWETENFNKKTAIEFWDSLRIFITRKKVKIVEVMWEAHICVSWNSSKFDPKQPPHTREAQSNPSRHFEHQEQVRHLRLNCSQPAENQKSSRGKHHQKGRQGREVGKTTAGFQGSKRPFGVTQVERNLLPDDKQSRNSHRCSGYPQAGGSQGRAREDTD